MALLLALLAGLSLATTSIGPEAASPPPEPAPPLEAPPGPPPMPEDRAEAAPALPSSPDSPGAPIPWLAAGASVLPGVLFHGAGHYAAGHRPEAYRLLAMEGLGLAALVAGFATLGAVGGSEKLAALYVPLAVGGAGLFGTSFLADLAGTLRGRRPWPEPFASPRLSIHAGYAGLYTSKHTFTHLGQVGASWQGDRLSTSAHALVHPHLDYFEYRVSAGWRAFAPREGDPVTGLTLFADLGQHHFREEGFAATTLRGYGELRWNLGHMLSTMRNAWLLARLGVGFDSFDFRAAAGADDGLPFLVVDLGIGLRATERFSLELAYRHRKGELPGGLVLDGGPAGFAGMVELQGRVLLAEGWSLLPGLRIGNGVLPWLLLESALY